MTDYLQAIVRFPVQRQYGILRATKFGIEEIVRTLLQYFPDLIDHKDVFEPNKLQIAVQARQEKIFNLILGMSPVITEELSSAQLSNPSILGLPKTTLKLVGKLAPPFKLYKVSCTALQMQRELQWLKWPPSSPTKGQEVNLTSPATSTPQEEDHDQMDHDQIQIHRDPSCWLGIWMWLWRCRGGAWRLGLASGLSFSSSRSFWIRFSGGGSGGCGCR
ncbi:hypothetical protein LWI29_022971 [Acer saccharum]|uniref:Uncharacterized protein n=1 Tax=Acer saccharum TaxID=4024 RepID=A0AA39W261_ACESA|nr:hypothetical protein LWI29_022971 [Acer saccharum]